MTPAVEEVGTATSLWEDPPAAAVLRQRALHSAHTTVTKPLAEAHVTIEDGGTLVLLLFINLGYFKL